MSSIGPCTSGKDPDPKLSNPCGRLLQLRHYVGKDGRHSAAVFCVHCDLPRQWRNFAQVKLTSPEQWAAWNRDVERRLPKAA